MRLVMLVLVLAIFGGCSSSQSQDRRYADGDDNAPDAPGETLEAKFIMPSGLSSDNGLELTHFRYENQWRESACAIGGGEAELPFAGREVIRLNLISDCEYRLLVWVGFYDGSVWNSV